ncbi:WD40/YVTN/BNR-like repeat-containing protein [Aquirufa sp. 5-AUSEE-100C1]
MMKKLLYAILIAVNLSAYGQWISVSIPSQASFRALKANGTHIWVGGTQGTVGHSRDGGRTWEFTQVPNAENLDFRDLAIVNEQEIMLMSAGPSEEGKARIYASNNEGKNWTLRLNNTESGYFYDCLQWDDKNKKAWLLADPIDQRLTLFSVLKDHVIRINPTKSPLLQTKEAFFAASGSSMIQLGNKIHLIGGGADSVKIYQYDIDRDSWTSIPLKVNAGEAKGYFSIGAKNKKTLWAVGGDYRKLNESSIPILISQDAGMHWTPMANTPKFYMEKVIWAKPYWIVSGPSQSAAYHEKTKRWKRLGDSHYHNIIQVGDVIWGIGAKGQLGYISLSSINQLFLSEK